EEKMDIKINGQIITIDESQKELLRATASSDDQVAGEHRKVIAQVMADAWKAGVLEPDLLGTIFTKHVLGPGVEPKFPFDFYGPENEDAYEAIVMPKHGRIPERVIEGDEARITTYKIVNSISWPLDYARDARWDVVARAIEVFTNGFTRKINDDGWHV